MVRKALFTALLLSTAFAAADDEREGVRPEDRIDVSVVDRRVFAVRAGDATAIVSVDLELGERVIATESRGLVGVALTDNRLLGVTSRSTRWQELRYRVAERASPPARFELGDRVALVVLPRRLAALAPGSTGWVEEALGPLEVPVSTHSRTNVAVAVTGRRAIAFSAKSGYVELRLAPEEVPASVSLQDSSATLTTGRRVLVFRSGDQFWREITRRVVP